MLILLDLYFLLCYLFISISQEYYKRNKKGELLMTLYNVFYKGDSNGNPPCYEVTTDNFEKWLKDHNSHREEDFQDDADDFKVEEISLYLYNNKKKK